MTAKAAAQTRLGQQLLRLRHILLERRALQRTRQRIGQECLADAPGVRRDVLGDRFVVDRPLDRLMHLHLLQLRHRLVHRDVHRGALRRRCDRQVLVAGDRLELVGAEVARDVDVALLQQQKLRRRIGDMAQDDASHQRLLRRVRVGVDDHVIARRPFGQLVRAGAGGARLQPGVAEVAVGLVRHDRLHVHHAADIGATGSTARSWWPRLPRAASSPACSRPARGSSSRRCPG